MAARVGRSDSEEFKRLQRRLNKKITDALSYIAETGVKECKQNHGYTDRTGKLTASMGYVFKTPNGTSVNMMASANKGGDPEKIKEGEQEGKTYAVNVGLSAIGGTSFGVSICAGAAYAHHVSERFSVLESAHPIISKLTERFKNALRDVNKD